MNFEEFKSSFQKKPVTEYPNAIPENPKISICVQTYNQAQYISQCIESILSQETSFDFEILLGDDFSNDGTREICIDYAQKYPEKIRLFLHERENNIVIDGNNTGLFNSFYNFYSARGEYIAYCDGDDYWTDPNKLQKQFDFLNNHNKYVLTYHRAKMVDETGEEIKAHVYLEMSKRDFSSNELKKAMVQPIISTWCFRNVIKDIPVDITGTINADNFWISMLGFYGEGKYLEDIEPSHYRIHNEGIWSLIKKERQLASKVTTYKNLSAFYKRSQENELSRYFKHRSENYSKMLIMLYLKKPSLFKASASIIRFLRYKYLAN